MRKLLLIGLLFAGACKSRTTEVPVTVPTPLPPVAGPGAPSPRLAVEGFLGAIRAQDVQGLSGVWGDKNGPVRDSKVMTREDMEQRAIYLIRCFKHDRFRLIGESPAADSERLFQVELTRGTLTKVTDFYTAKGGDRWYMRYANLDPVKDLCTAK